MGLRPACSRIKINDHTHLLANDLPSLISSGLFQEGRAQVATEFGDSYVNKKWEEPAIFRLGSILQSRECYR